VRRLALLLGVAAALLLAGCGGSSSHAHRRPANHGAANGPASHLVSADVIASAARLSARQQGYAIAVAGNGTVSGIDGAITFTGAGVFDASGGGDLSLQVNLPGLFSIVSPLKTVVLLGQGSAYVKVPALLTQSPGGLRPWVSIPLASAGHALGLPTGALSGEVTPRRLLDALATDSTGHADWRGQATVDGHTQTLYRELLPALGKGRWLYVWIDPRTGLLSRVAVSYARAGRAALNATLTFTGYGQQTVPALPPTDKVGSVDTALKAIGL